MKVRTLVRTGCVHVILAGVLAAQEVNAQDARLQQRLDPPTAAAVAALVDSASALGLPTEPLVQKALEGQSKGATGDAIVAAVRALVRDLAIAREALGDDVGPDALSLAAAALDAGVAPSHLERLRLHRSQAAFPAGLAGVVYLTLRGVPAEQSVDLIAAMLDARLSEAEFASLQRMVERDLRAGVPPARAAAVRTRALILHGRVHGPTGGPRS
ncbi:MAG: hypothetical protein FWJ74_01405 [Gemmatimonadota bacterium]